MLNEISNQLRGFYIEELIAIQSTGLVRNRVILATPENIQTELNRRIETARTAKNSNLLYKYRGLGLI